MYPRGNVAFPSTDLMSLADRVTALWHSLRAKPGGTWLFSRMLGRAIPYSGTMGAHVRELKPGFARLTLRDRRRVRNHLRSIHAIALANLGELTSGLALIPSLPRGTRSILTAISVEYLKKARGTLEARCQCAVPEAIRETTEIVLLTEIRDAAGDEVARVRATWRLSPDKI